MGDGRLRTVLPKDFSACAAGTLGDARGDIVSDPGKIIMKLHVNRGHDTANQPKHVLVDSVGGNSHLVNFVDEVHDHCEVRRASDKAPRVPVASTSAVSMFNEKVQADHLFLMILLRCARSICLPRIHYSSRFIPKTHRRFGAAFFVVGWAPLAHPRASKWMKGENGRIEFGRNCARIV